MSARSKSRGLDDSEVVAAVHLRLRPRHLLLVVASMIASGSLIVGCSSTGARPVSLAALAADEERYAGDEVRTQGVVRRFSGSSGPHFVLEDAEQNRVRLVPADEVAGREGDRVTVVGTFDFAETTGRVIHIARLEPADARPDRAIGLTAQDAAARHRCSCRAA